MTTTAHKQTTVPQTQRPAGAQWTAACRRQRCPRAPAHSQSHRCGAHRDNRHARRDDEARGWSRASAGHEPGGTHGEWSVPAPCITSCCMEGFTIGRNRRDGRYRRASRIVANAAGRGAAKPSCGTRRSAPCLTIQIAHRTHTEHMNAEYTSAPARPCSRTALLRRVPQRVCERREVCGEES
jgi:hypothetical protein